MHFSLQSRSPCTANAKPADILVSFSTNSINNFFNTTAKSQSTIDAVQLLLFIKFQHNLYLHFLNTVKKLTYFIIHQLSLCCKLFHQEIVESICHISFLFRLVPFIENSFYLCNELFFIRNHAVMH